MTHLDEVQAELTRAQAAFPPMRSAHEALAIIEEEFEEFKHEVFHGTQERAREEVIQVAAMALRFLVDISDAPQTNAPIAARFA